MKVLIITTSYLRHSKDLSGIFIANELYAIKKNFPETSFTVLMPGETNIPIKESIDQIDIVRFNYWWPRKQQALATDSGIPTDLKKSLWAKIQLPFFLLFFLWQITKLAKKHDIIHAHFLPCGLLATTTKWLHRKPIITTLHGTDYKILQKPIVAKLLVLFIKRIDRWVSLGSESLKSLHLIPITQNKLIESKLAINLKQFSFNPPDFSNWKNRFQMVWVGRVVPIKNLSLLINAIHELKKKIPHIHCIIIGTGSDLDKIKTLTSNLNLDHHFSFTGFIPNQELNKFYQDADCFILTSDSEGLPASILEAMACGIPIVSTPVGSIPDIIENHHNGYLFEKNNLAQLVETVYHLFETGEQNANVVKSALKTVQEKFDENIISQKINQLYHSTADNVSN